MTLEETDLHDDDYDDPHDDTPAREEPDWPHCGSCLDTGGRDLPATRWQAARTVNCPHCNTQGWKDRLRLFKHHLHRWRWHLKNWQPRARRTYDEQPPF